MSDKTLWEYSKHAPLTSVWCTKQGCTYLQLFGYGSPQLDCRVGKPSLLGRDHEPQPIQLHDTCVELQLRQALKLPQMMEALESVSQQYLVEEGLMQDFLQLY